MEDAPYIIGLDLSKSRSGIAEGYVGAVPHAHSIVGRDLDVQQAMMKLGNWLIRRIGVTQPKAVYFEAPIDGGAFRPNIDWEKREWKSTRDPNTTVVLAKMVGVVEFICGMKGIPAIPINVRTARSKFLGTGGGNLKGDLGKRRARALCNLLGWPVENLDEADAIAVWFAGCLDAAPHLAWPISPMDQAKVMAMAFDEETAKRALRKVTPQIAPKGQQRISAAEARDLFARGARR